MSGDTTGRSSTSLIAIFLFVGVPALLSAVSVLNLLQIADDRFGMAERDVQLAALTRRLDRPTADGKPLDLSRIYLAGASRTLASAALQQMLVSAVAATSGRLIETASVDAVPTDGSAGPEEISLKVTLDIDNDGLLQLLYALETGVPLLDIKTLSVRRLSEAADDGTAGTLRVDILVSGRWRSPAA